MFEKVQQTRASDGVTYQIEESVVKGKLKPGDRLPSERELQKIMGVSRGTLREALRILEQKGLIEVKNGVKGGMFIRDINTDNATQSLALLLRLEKISLDELGEFREGLVGLGLAMAVERAQKKDIAHLKKRLAEAEVHLKQGTATWLEFNSMSEFLVSLIGNRLYEMVINLVHENAMSYFRYLPDVQRDLHDVYIVWCEMLDALEKKDPEKMTSVIRAHIRDFLGRMKKQQVRL